MKAGKILLAALAVLMLAAGSAGSALAWGNAPTHLSIANDLVKTYPLIADDHDLFICASVGPDIGKTQLFRITGRGYVHDPKFAEIMWEVAKQKNREDWKDMARAWVAHLAADDIGHITYIPEDDPEHALVEVAVDTCIYFSLESPLGNWEAYNQDLGPQCCDPRLIYLASRKYCKEYGLPKSRVVWPWMTREALKNLKTAIAAEYGYIKAKGNALLSEWYLAKMEAEGKVPVGGWQPHYENSIVEAYNRIDSLP